MWVHLQGFFVGLDPALKIQGIDPALAFQKIRLLFLVQLALRGGETAAQSQATDQRPRAATQAHPKRHEPRLTEGFSKNQFFLTAPHPVSQGAPENLSNVAAEGNEALIYLLTDIDPGGMIERTSNPPKYLSLVTSAATFLGAPCPVGQPSWSAPQAAPRLPTSSIPGSWRSGSG